VDASPLHLVSAFAAGAGLVLGQRATAEKSNEKTAIPELLATLALEGCIVTIDAMGTQPNIAQAIRDRGASYILSVKDNQPSWPIRYRTSLSRFNRRRTRLPTRLTKSWRKITADWRCGVVTPSTRLIVCMPRSAGRTSSRLP
jgi:hypothetical protein